MELAMPITHPTSPDTVLLRAGYTLDAKTISRLTELHAREIWINYPGMEFVVEQICPKIISAGQCLSAAIGKAFGEVMPDGKVDLDYHPYRRAISELMERLVASPKAATLVVDLASSQVPLARSAGHGSFLSLLLGMKLETYLMLSRSRLGVMSRDVSNLGLGALLRDVGFTQLESDERWRWRPADDEVDPTWREHVQCGYEMLRGNIEPSAAAAVLHHHQHFDGTGFPHRIDLQGDAEPISGTDIHIFARIIAVADVFDRLRHPAPAGPDQPEPTPVPVVRVQQQMLRTEIASWFDPLVLRALVHAVPTFPPGSMVTLSDGRRAAVLSHNPLDPCRPVVAVLTHEAMDPDTFAEPGEQIDLHMTPELHIVRAEGTSVADDLFEPTTPDEFNIHKAQTELIVMPVDRLAS